MDTSATVVIVIGAVSLVAFLSVWTSKVKSTSLPLPPGPRRIPFIGNALDVDITEPHLTYTQWGRQYGDVIYSRLLGQDYIVVNSEKVARTLSDARRSAVYADRPMLAIFKLLGVDTSTAVLAYGDTWKVHRKLFHQTVRSDVIVKYQPFYTSKAISLVHDLLQDGAASNLGSILQSFAATTALSFTYGIKSQDHPLVKLVQRLTDIIAKEAIPEKTALLQTFPFIMYLPSWFPGLGFIERATTSKQLAKEVWEQPFEYTKNEVAAGTAPQSMVADFLISHQEDRDKDSEIYQELEAAMKAVAATVFLGGADTSSSTLHTFILAMILFPEVQEKAQAEIDSVVGIDRLPTFDDRDALPYVDAVICETLRWHPVSPLGMPHATTTDDVYQGFHIPKGAIVIFNMWAMSRDCVNADQFNPDRHLLPTGELSPTAGMTRSLVFGFGRRVCPGRFFAENVLWAAVVQTLATLRFSKARDANGRPIEINPVFTNGITSQPAPFQLTITGTESKFDQQMRAPAIVWLRVNRFQCAEVYLYIIILPIDPRCSIFFGFLARDRCSIIYETAPKALMEQKSSSTQSGHW